MAYTLHVISYIDSVYLIGEESVAEMHSLFFAARVNGDHAGVHDDDHADDEVVLLQDRVGDQGH